MTSSIVQTSSELFVLHILTDFKKKYRVMLYFVLIAVAFIDFSLTHYSTYYKIISDPRLTYTTLRLHYFSENQH